MTYTQADLDTILHESCANLRKAQPMLFQQEHDINERTVSVELASEIRNSVDDFHVNCEYNRMVDENGTLIPKRIYLNPNAPQPSRVFPDIIIHKQEDGEHNLLVVEIKMQWKNAEKAHDIDKLHGYMNELGYLYGLYLELGENGIVEMQWFQKA